ncbi:unnamed protein product [Prorocentrum cordatum]|uniref:Programmed cell death protein 5 n=1 Tax=Prorocentrum cordatum TaxID=2364126 RepID=A0ABN9UK06_9DINO|nr:unnamed protein product [Polarella glacialis]
MQAGEEARARAAASQRGDQDAQLERMQEQAQKQKEMEEQKRVMVRQVLEPEALERLHRVGLVKPEKQMQIEGVILNMVQSGQMQEKMSDTSLISIIEKIDGMTKAKGSSVKMMRKRRDDDDDDIDLDNL